MGKERAAQARQGSKVRGKERNPPPEEREKWTYSKEREEREEGEGVGGSRHRPECPAADAPYHEQPKQKFGLCCCLMTRCC